jgi:predicted dehydrogenase
VYTTKTDRLRVAFIGTDGMGGAHINEMQDKVDCFCYCDVDSNRWGKAMKQYPHAKGYQDYRRMFEKETGNFDAVMIGVPDHHHYPATMMAMQLGKHVYTQKPLTHTVWEARRLTQAANEYNVVTQMGNQGHAGEGWRLVYEWIHSGTLGDITEVHTWTDRPIWPQGAERPDRQDTPPDKLDWDAWLGPAPERSYVTGDAPDKPGPYHWFNWRGWWDFGAGALGDMACHTMDGMFWALDPGPCTSVEPITQTPCNGDSFPKASMLKWTFPKKGRRAAFDAYWYDGGLRPDFPTDLEIDRRMPSTGNLFIGTKATMLVSGDYGNSPRIIPEARMKDVGKPEQILERSPGHYQEWIEAASGNKPTDFTQSNFAYAGPMTETILLGNVAVRMGRRLEWDGEALKVTNVPEANQYINKEYREGWKV